MRSIHSTALDDRRIAVADCDNFFVSCERKVDTSLEGRPVVVLSCNDGCVVSRSNEVKQMGVKMGDPYFKIRDMLAYNGVAIRSSNLSLYTEISATVMRRLNIYTDSMEQYSVDEAFLNMGIASIKDPIDYCRKIRDDVWRHCQIPVSIGIAPSKTLAKLSTEYAKHNKEATRGVFWMDMAHYKNMPFMGQFSCGDIWGIGPRTAIKLIQSGVRTAEDFLKLDQLYIKKYFGILLLNTYWELQGRLMIPIADVRKPPKSIMVSRSFGQPITTYGDLLDPLICFTVSASKQLRLAKQKAKRLCISVETSRFKPEKFYANQKEVIFSTPTDLDSVFIPAVKQAFQDIYVAGYEYKRCGVVLYNFSDMSCGCQTALFSDSGEAMDKRARASEAADIINRECGRPVIRPAAVFARPGEIKAWLPKSEYKSNATVKADSPLPNGLRFQSHAEDVI